MSLLAIVEPAYISVSVLFEGDFAFELFARHAPLFSRQDVLPLAGSDDNLWKFISRKRTDYADCEHRYARYFSDAWKVVEDAAPTIAMKRQDTTQFLKRNVKRRLASLPAPVGRATGNGAPANAFRLLTERLRDILEESGVAPVTPRLFEPVFERVSARDEWRYHLNRNDLLRIRAPSK